MDGYDTDDILSQALDLAEEENDNEIFITQNAFQAEFAIEEGDPTQDIVDASYFLGNENHNHNRGSTTALNGCDEEKTLPSSYSFSGNFALDAWDVFSDATENQNGHQNNEGTASTSENRFSFLTEEEVRGDMTAFVPDNTRRKAIWAANIYDAWKIAAKLSSSTPHIRHLLDRDLLNLTDDDLIAVLPSFFTSAKRQDGEDYQADTINSIACGLVKYFEMNERSVPLLSHEKFKHVRNAISNTMRKKVQAGVGLFKRKAEPISTENEDQLWKRGFLGIETPHTLLRTTFWLIGINFGLRGGQEHRSLTFENFQLEKDTEGNDALHYVETISKTFCRGLEHRNIEPHSAKAFQNKTHPERCLVSIFKLYHSRLPKDRPKNAFYFQPLSKRYTETWFSKQPIGKNKLETVVRDTMKEAGIEGYFTNHSLRATTATRLFNAGVPEQLVREQTGHRSNAIWSYNRPSEIQKRKVSEILQVQDQPQNQPCVETSQLSRPTKIQKKENSAAINVDKDRISFVFNNSNVTVNFK